MTNLNIALTLNLNDRLVAPLQRALNEVAKGVKEIEKELNATQKTGVQTGRTLSNLQGPGRAAKEAAELARNTQNALGLAERLKNAWSSTGNVLKGVTTGMAAFQAAKFVMAAPLQQARSYDRQLADAANTAFTRRDTAGRRAGMGDINNTVENALRAGGGKREDVLGALNEMLASGTISPDQAKTLLPTAAKYATAGNADIKEISNIVVRALQNGFKDADIPKILDMALDAGQRGGFELKDMAKWLPKLLAAGNMSGLNGMDGYARILGSAQGSVITAGSKDEAGNNLLNLLLKINSSDTAKDAQKLGIDLSGSLAAARGKGMNSLDAFVALVDQVAGRDANMVKLRQQATLAGTDEQRKSTLNAQADILQGSAIGKIVQDRQALLSLVAELNKREYIREVAQGVMGANGQVGSANFALIAGTADFKTQQGENEKLFALTKGLDPVNAALGKLAETTTDLYRQYPELAKAIEVTKLAVYGLAVASAAAGGAVLLQNGGALGGAARTLMGGGGGALSLVGRVAGAGVAGAAGYGAGTLLYDHALAGNGSGDNIGAGIARLLAFFGNDEAKRSTGQMDAYDKKMDAEIAAMKIAMLAVADRPIRVILDGREIASQADSYQQRFARRN